MNSAFDDKKGEEKMMSVYWFIMVVVIAGGVVAMVSMFHGNAYDVREVEANLVVNKFSDCVSESGKLNEDFLNNSDLKQNVSLESVCSFDFAANSAKYGDKERSEYFLEGRFSEFSSGKHLENYSAGSLEFKPQCKTQNETQKYDRFVRCVNRTFYVSSGSGSSYEINVLSAVSKSDKNV